EQPAVAMLAYDDRFLYFAASCQGTRAPVEQAKSTRVRDADLAGHDHLELLIDVDRDGVSYFRLAIDQRGWTRDDCWGDVSWNPQWFVAAAQETGVWTVEAAIPLVALTGEPSLARTAWGVGVQRTTSAHTFQAWTEPAATSPRIEGLGLLI